MITHEQLEKRRNYLGSSDIAAILGESPYSNAYDVWLEKTGRLITKDYSKNKSLETGTFLEVGVLDWAENQLGKIMRYNNNDEVKKENIEIIVPGFPIIDHPDAILISENNPLEAKTAGLMGPLKEPYGEGINELPLRVIIQGHVHMLALGADKCYVPVLLGGVGFKMYICEKLDWLMETIMDSSIKFWDEYVLTNTPPPNIIPTGEYVKRVKREPNKTIDIPDQIVKNWLSSKETLKHAESIKNESENALLSAMGDAEVGVYSEGMVNYFTQQQKRIDSTRLKEELPDIAKQYEKISKFRVLRNKITKSKDKFNTNFIE